MVSVSRRAYRRVGGLGGIHSIGSKFVAGVGAAALGNVISSRVPQVPPMIAGPALGFLFGGGVGAISALVAPMIMNAVTSHPSSSSSPAGQVFV